MRLIAISLLASAIAAPASAQSADPRDVRCLLTMSALASNPQFTQAALNGVYYFVGRVTAKAPSFGFSTDLPQEARKMSLADFQTETRRCAVIMAEVDGQLKQAKAALAGFQPKN